MADISSSAAKEHVLKGAGDVQRISGDAVAAARDMGHQYLQSLGRRAAASAAQAGRKTIMIEDLKAGGGAESAPVIG